MKKFYTVILLVHLQFSVNTLLSQTFSVTTIKGAVQQPTFAAGSIVHVLANPTPTNNTLVFNKWIGNTVALKDTFSMHTTFTITGNQTLTATYKPATPWTAVNHTFATVTNTNVAESNTYRYFPPNYKALIIFYHGAGGTASGWLDGSKVETNLFCRSAAEQGFALFAPESIDRTTKKWASTAYATNSDVANVHEMLDSLKLMGILSPTTPIYGVSMSEGGGILSQIAYYDNYKAEAIYCNDGLGQAINTSTIPTIFPYQRWDTLGTQGNIKIQYVTASYDTLIANGVAAEFPINYPSPIFKTRFWRIQGVDSLTSLTYYNWFKTNNLLNSNDFLIKDPRDTPAGSAWQSPFASAFGTSKVPDADDQLYTCFTEHKFTNDFTYKTLRFFSRFLPANSVSIKENNFANDILMYPNPANDFITIQSIQTISSIKILDVLGNEVLESISLKSIDIKNLATGIYFIQLQSGNNFITKKIIKN